MSPLRSARVMSVQILRRCFCALALAQIWVGAVTVARAAGPAEIPQASWEGSLAVQACEASDLSLPDQTEIAMQTVYLVRTGNGRGSAVVISRDGFVLTAAHVVGDAEQVELENAAGVTFNAKVIRTDHYHDVALLQLQATTRDFDCAQISVERQALGSDVFALGNPGGEALAFSVTKGIVSSRRDLGGRQFLQIDASINMGNSGGPLMDVRAHVVGIVSWKMSAREIEGIAFGIPVATALRVLEIDIDAASSDDPSHMGGRRGAKRTSPLDFESDRAREGTKSARPPLTESQQRRRKLGNGLVGAGSGLAAVSAVAILGTATIYWIEPDWTPSGWKANRAINTTGWVGLGLGVGAVTWAIIVKHKLKKDIASARTQAMILPTPSGIQLVGRF